MFTVWSSFWRRKGGPEESPRAIASHAGKLFLAVYDLAMNISSVAGFGIVLLIPFLCGAAGAVLVPGFGAVLVPDDDLLGSFGSGAHLALLSSPCRGFAG